MAKKSTISKKQKRILDVCLENIFGTNRWKEISGDYPHVSSVSIRFCSMIDKERGDKKTKEQKRAFAHVGHKPNKICISRDFFFLPVNIQRGILYHEIGHLFTPGGDEKDADKFMFDNFGIKIKYNNDLELQYI